MTNSFSFRSFWLEDDGGFTWRSALGLVSACKAAYLPPDHAIRLAQDKWFMQAETFNVGDIQGLILEDHNVTVVAFRGTDSVADWLSNIRVTPTRVPAFKGSVHKGFLKAYQSVSPMVDAAVARSGGKKLWFTGHSLGGAIAVMAALSHQDREIAGLMTFGQPRLLGRRPSKHINARFGRGYQRFVNRNDIVTRIPPGYRHAGVHRHFTDVDFDDSFAEAVESIEEETTQLSTPEFEAMQAQLDALKVQVEAHADAGIDTEGFGSLDTDELLETSAEGLIPGLSAHKIDAYLAEVNSRATTEMATGGVHETFQARRVEQFSLETTVAEEPLFVDDFPMEAAGDDADFLGVEDDSFAESFGGAPDPTPVADPENTYLVRLRSAAWTPPAGVDLRSIVGNIASISTTRGMVNQLSGDPLIHSVEASREAGIEDVDTSVPYVKGTAVHSRPDLPEKGDGALVGVIDTGIDVLHQAFEDDAGKSRIVAVWLQRDKTGPTPRDVDPTAFRQNYGTLYTAERIAEIREAHRRDGTAPPAGLRDEFSGHGTHVASIAAGRAFGEIGDGMAPQAGIVVVSAHMTSDPDNPDEPRSIGYSSSHVDALAFLKGVANGGNAVNDAALPMAINVSLGMNAGAHDGKTALEAAFDGITGGGRDPGLVIVKSAGNERNHGGHASAQAAKGAVVDIEWQTDDNSRRRDYLEAWFEPGDDIAFTLVSPMGDRIGPVDFQMPEVTEDVNGMRLRLALSEIHSDNGHNRLAISVERREQDILGGVWRLEMVGRELFSRDGKVHIWVERVRRRSIKFLNPDRGMTLSVPGTAESIVTVGACNSAMPMRLLGMSSLGLTRDGRPKPELCAPGEMITAAAAGGATDAAVTKSGTSMAAPHVTGAVALVFSGRAKTDMRQVNAQQLQQKLRLTTQNFSPIHNPGFGSGVLDAQKLVSDLT